MLSRIVVGLALGAYALVLGCVWAGSRNEDPRQAADTSAPMVHASTSGKIAGLPYVGAGMQIQRVDWIPEYKKNIDEIAAIGGDTVLLVVDMRMENGTSSRIYLDMRMTPTPDLLGDLIDHAKKKNLRVILMPIVLLDNPRGNEWRGTIHPESWEDWWQSYRDCLANHFAWIAQAHGVDVLVIGSELVSTEGKGEEWQRTIRAVRQQFKGKLTYSANWDHYTNIPFWKDLDLMATNSYYKLGEDRDVTVEQIERRWAEIQNDVLRFSRKINKPLLFTEVGWCSMANAAHEPWDYTKESEDMDEELQKKLYEGFFNSWWGKKGFGGFMIWEWTPGDGGKGDDSQKRGYTPENKPAEGVVKEWFGKPRWEVK